MSPMISSSVCGGRSCCLHCCSLLVFVLRSFRSRFLSLRTRCHLLCPVVFVVLAIHGHRCHSKHACIGSSAPFDQTTTTRLAVANASIRPSIYLFIHTHTYIQTDTHIHSDRHRYTRGQKHTNKKGHADIPLDWADTKADKPRQKRIAPTETVMPYVQTRHLHNNNKSLRMYSRVKHKPQKEQHIVFVSA